MYHYTESGLKNVWLENGWHVMKTRYGDAVSIENADGLHRAIGRHLAAKPNLTGAEFRFLRRELDLSQGCAAGLLGTTGQALSLWERKGRVPRTAERMFRALYLETVDGNVKIRELIERAAGLDRRESGKLVFRDTGKEWLPLAA